MIKFQPLTRYQPGDMGDRSYLSTMTAFQQQVMADVMRATGVSDVMRQPAEHPYLRVVTEDSPTDGAA